MLDGRRVVRGGSAGWALDIDDQRLRWGDRTGFIEVGDGPPESTQQLIAWVVGDDRRSSWRRRTSGPPRPQQPALPPAKGIGVGTAHADLVDASSEERSLNGFDGDRVSIFFPGSESGALNVALDGATVIGIGNGPPDCAAPDDEER